MHKESRIQEKRQKEWDQFIDDMKLRSARIDNGFEKKEEELRDFYAELKRQTEYY